MAARGVITHREERGVAFQQMRNAQRSAHHSAPAVIVEVRLRLRLSAQRELLGVGGRALPLDGQVAMNALTPAISAIADELAVAVASGTVAAPWPAESTATTSAAEPTSTAASTTAGPAKPRSTSTRTAATGSSGSAWNTAWLALDAQSPETAAGGALHAQHRSTQSEIIRAVLQACAQRSIYQEGFVGVG